MTQRRTYRVTSDSVDELNFVLAQLADRLDQMEGYRGNPKFVSDIDLDGNLGTNSGNASASTDLSTLGQVGDEITSAISSILQYNKPVGTIHITTNSANPATYLGYGTWAAFGSGKVLVGLDATDTDFDTVLETGGAKTAAIAAHTHTINHTHGAGTTVDNNADGSTVQVADAAHTGNSGSSAAGGAASVVQPYVVVYMWRRTA